MNEISREEMSKKLQEHLTQEQAEFLLNAAVEAAGLPEKESYDAEETERLRAQIAELGNSLTALLNSAKA